MLNPITAIQKLRPTLWNMPDDSETQDLPEIVEGDLVEFTDHNDTYDGCGIIHYFTRAEFKNEETGAFEMLPCAVIVSANPNTDWHDFIPMQNIDPLSLTRYVELYEETYGELSAVSRLQLRRDVGTKMQTYSRINNGGSRYMPPMPQANAAVPFQGGVA